MNAEKDKCQLCRGERGGVPGNENVVTNCGGIRVVVCDYCHADLMRGKLIPVRRAE